MIETPAPSCQVVIAGGGIGGLATALALARKRIPSLVLERRDGFKDDGAGIQIGPNGTRILAALGAASFIEKRATSPDVLRIRDAATARELACFPLGPWIAARHGAPYWAAHRRDLHAALLAAAGRDPLVRLKTGNGVAGATENADRVAVTMMDGTTVECRALIAADGAWSRLRTDVFGAVRPSYTGKSAVRTVIPVSNVPDELSANEVNLWLGPNVHVVHYPVSAGEAVAVVAIFDDGRIAGDWNTPCNRNWVAGRTQTFTPLLKNFLAQPDTWRRWSLLALAKPPKLAVGRMALLGDAAHPILPFLAQGGVMALEDAMTVADALSAHAGDPSRAFASYAKARAARVRRVATASRMNGRIYHFGGIMARARNAAFERIPPEHFMRRYDWIYGWRHVS